MQREGGVDVCEWGFLEGGGGLTEVLFLFILFVGMYSGKALARLHLHI